MRSVDDFRNWAARRWRRQWPDWLAANAAGPDSGPKQRAELTGWFVLRPPVEAEMARDPEGVAAWVRHWQRFEATHGVRVEWVTKAWSSMGAQRLPERATAGPEASAALAGEATTWRRAVWAADLLREAWPDADLTVALRASARALGALDEDDAVRLLAVLAWLATHPGSGLWERELPVVDVHTKWLERHRALVEALVAALSGTTDLGLRRSPVRFRVRLLDPAFASGPADFTVDLDTLAGLALAPQRVLICENATTIATLPTLPGTVAVHGMGFAAPILADVPWVRAADCWYWGDLDTYGFLILGRVRAALPGVTSVLMDAATWQRHEHLAVDEPRPFRGEIGYLSAAELDCLRLVRRGDRRLEQERIPRETAERALAALV